MVKGLNDLSFSFQTLEALALLQSMHRRQLERNLITYSVTISACEKGRGWCLKWGRSTEEHRKTWIEEFKENCKMDRNLDVQLCNSQFRFVLECVRAC